MKVSPALVHNHSVVMTHTCNAHDGMSNDVAYLSTRYEFRAFFNHGMPFYACVNVSFVDLM